MRVRIHPDKTVLLYDGNLKRERNLIARTLWDLFDCVRKIVDCGPVLQEIYDASASVQVCDPKNEYTNLTHRDNRDNKPGLLALFQKFRLWTAAQWKRPRFLKLGAAALMTVAAGGAAVGLVVASTTLMAAGLGTLLVGGLVAADLLLEMGAPGSDSDRP